MASDDVRGRTGAIVAAIAGVALLALGGFLVYLGATYVEPAERIATRPVGDVPPFVLRIVGGAIGLVGIVIAAGSRRR